MVKSPFGDFKFPAYVLPKSWKIMTAGGLIPYTRKRNWARNSQIVMLEDRLKNLHPKSLLDIGCRRGEFIITVNAYCDNITAIDIDPEYIKAAIKENNRPNITYQTGKCLRA